ncbi:MAG: DUF86 domain-containing protein [Hormoscilla sp. SP5CHS1]|nr:DUF86 domain-containing protein [Hormoscilla sp. SP12CHS1]MBC6452660.1 DUF86 domain-containing protein [Hormoscilla sp. SP5CHS1]MBO1351973.1 DUF86 domain-containing protein [Hormoscilla sp. GUM202]
MYENDVLLERLLQILEALERIPERFESISVPQDFCDTKAGREHLDSICMVLLAVGESFKQINQKTDEKFLIKYPEIPWRKVMGLRNVLAHVYFEVDPEQIYSICKDDIPLLIDTVQQMIQDLEDGTTS